MLGNLLLALGLSASIGVSSLMPYRAGNPSYALIEHPNNSAESQSIWVDNFNDALSYDVHNGVYSVSINLCYDTGGYPLYDLMDYPYGSTSNRTYRGFYISNGDTQPTFNVGTNVYDYLTPSTNNYILMYFNGNTGFTLSTGGQPNTSATFTGVQYFSLGYTILFDLYGSFSQSNSTYREVIDSSKWNRVSDTQYNYVSSNLDLDINDFDFLNLRFTFIPTTPTQSWDNGYEYGYENGYDTGYGSGYNSGFADGVNGFSWFSLLASIADTPVLMLRSLFNWDVFGVPLISVVLSLMTGLFVLFILKKIF